MATSVTPKPLPQRDLEHILDHTKVIWEQREGERFFLTGGTGFFGRWLLESWAKVNDALSLGMEMTVLARDPDRFLASAPHLAKRKDLRFHIGDVKDFRFPEEPFDHIIHAATTSARHIPAAETLDTILLGTRRVLDLAKQCGARNLLFTSSGAVYGKQPVNLERIPEDYSGAPAIDSPASAYGEGKRAAELLGIVHSENADFDFKIARCFAFVGPLLPLDSHFAIGNFIRDELNGSPIEILSDRRVFRSYLYASDLAIWLWHILFQGKPSRPYNVGSSAPVTLPELARTIVDAGASKKRIQIIDESNSQTGTDQYVPDTLRAEKELDIQQLISLRSAIEKTLTWHNRH